MANERHDPANPLAGIRIIELSSFVASPLGGMTLAQLGADVIRVDPLGGAPDITRWPLLPDHLATGDEAAGRQVAKPPHTGQAAGARTTDTGRSLYWAGLNKGKRSVTVDLRSAEGRELVARLIAECGYVVTNAPPRAGLTYEELIQRRPDLVHVQLYGTRDGGNAVDYTVNAALGFPAVTGPEQHEGPVNHVLPAWDVATGLYLAIGLLAAERHRLRTGEGQRIEVALQDVALATAGNLGFLAEAQLCPEPRPRLGNHMYGEFGRDFTTGDGQRVMVLVLSTRHWRDLLRATGMEEVATALERALDADFTTTKDRYEHREALGGLLTPWFARRTCQEIEDALKGTSVLWSRYRTFADLAANDAAALRAEPLMAELDQPGIGRHLAPGSPLLMGGIQRPPSPAPLLGQHTNEVLNELLSLDDHAIRDLQERGVVH